MVLNIKQNIIDIINTKIDLWDNKVWCFFKLTTNSLKMKLDGKIPPVSEDATLLHVLHKVTT